jgi:hypothetical protein
MNLKYKYYPMQQGRTAYDIAQENRDWTIARIIRKNAGLPYPKYWLTPPPDPPKSPVIFLPLEHHGLVREQVKLKFAFEVLITILLKTNI